MPVHDWTRVTAGTFHHFHTAWITHLSEHLNGGLLPEGYYAMAEQRAGQTNPDVLTLKAPDGEPVGEQADGAIALAEAPPKVAMTLHVDEVRAYAVRRRTLAIRHRTRDEIVALIEIASPANKDRESSVREFIDKASSCLGHGYHLLIIDLFPPGPNDPGGLNGAIWDEVGGGPPFDLPADRPLTLAAYPASGEPAAYVEPVGVGTALPDMPLFLDRDWYVNVPLEDTYTAAYRGVPQRWRSVVEG